MKDFAVAGLRMVIVTYEVTEDEVIAHPRGVQPYAVRWMYDLYFVAVGVAMHLCTLSVSNERIEQCFLEAF